MSDKAGWILLIITALVTLALASVAVTETWNKHAKEVRDDREQHAIKACIDRGGTVRFTYADTEMSLAGCDFVPASVQQ